MDKKKERGRPGGGVLLEPRVVSAWFHIAWDADVRDAHIAGHCRYEYLVKGSKGNMPIFAIIVANAVWFTSAALRI